LDCILAVLIADGGRAVLLDVRARIIQTVMRGVAVASDSVSIVVQVNVNVIALSHRDGRQAIEEAHIRAV